ncbi:MAG TPA: GDP-mannose 4,6-dehydratase, partial [Candidatus Omnitrophota bacterium]|nr:GDP-mannose 4,6-dehydratase [Candidatus Omnitrophota bacterium]
MKSEQQIIMVTGGSGFIGSNFVRYMLKKYKNYKIVNFDALTYAGNPDNLRDIASDKRYKFVKGNIAKRNDVKAVMKNVDYVVHFAAESHVDRSIKRSEVFIKTNIVGTHMLLELARENKIKKFVHVSTDEVYGSLGSAGYFTEK